MFELVGLGCAKICTRPQFMYLGELSKSHSGENQPKFPRRRCPSWSPGSEGGALEVGHETKTARVIMIDACLVFGYVTRVVWSLEMAE